MEFKDTLEQFLKVRKEGAFYDSSVITYRRKLDVFFKFLYIEYESIDTNYVNILSKIDDKMIIRSVEYYINTYDIKFKVTVDHYFIVVKEYFKFLLSEYKIKNENFDSFDKNIKLKNLVDKKIKDMNLNTTEQKQPITKSKFDEINSLCNKKIELFQKSGLKSPNKDKNYYNKPLTEFISAIIVKIIMLTGIKNQVIGKLIINDLDTQLNKIRINGFWIHLPDNLGKQLKKFVEIRNEIVKDPDERSLFVNKRGEGIGKYYSLMFAVLKSISGNMKAESVAKFTIMNMIKKGINSSIIQKLTTFGNDTYLHCQELINEEKKYDLKSKNRYLDSKIRGLDFFDEL